MSNRISCFVVSSTLLSISPALLPVSETASRSGSWSTVESAASERDRGGGLGLCLPSTGSSETATSLNPAARKALA
ncbi:hypothetical protein PF010_g14273 [Phytophthora fragariae]|uniref:RxLR effector protein n=1 Tax=Phytophthora fragariae TaxID=53985 RepID=A0A6A3K364_9STRA|nr:hypothetical protein PF011_g14097 [Phytophthora fragariae]KAE9101989.1 hypothetical protein PF010_g14273 [Phytophthora fragariae]